MKLVIPLCITLLPAIVLPDAAMAANVPADHAEKMARGLDLFRKDVGPLLREHCVKCHGGEKTKGDLDLATRDGLLLGGAEGAAVKPFDASASRMMKLIRHEETPKMPEKKPRLPDDAIAKIAAWIDLGAPYDVPLVAGKTPPRDRSQVTDEDRKWWSFQPLARITPPAGAGNPIDAFLTKAAQAKQLALNPPARAYSALWTEEMTVHWKSHCPSRWGWRKKSTRAAAARRLIRAT